MTRHSKNLPKVKKNITMKDIAERAGVSQRSVSQALLPGSGKVRVSEKTRKRVRAIAAKMGYRHNSVARSLRTGKSDMLGVLCFGNMQYLGSHRLTHCLNEIEARGMTPFVYHVEKYDPQRVSQACDVMINTKVDAVLILHPPMSVTRKNINFLRQAGLPVATLGGTLFKNTGGFLTDKTDAFSQLTQHLIDQGFHSITLLSVNLPQGTQTQRMFHAHSAQTGFKAAIRTARAAGVPISARIHHLARTVASQSILTFPNIHGLHAPGYIAVREMIESNTLPEAFLCQTDQWAFGALQAFAEFNIRVPDDLAIAGFEDLAVSSSGSVPLTTVAEPLQALSKAAVEYLIQLLNETPKPAARHVLMHGNLIQRKSTIRTVCPPPPLPVSQSTVTEV